MVSGTKSMELAIAVIGTVALIVGLKLTSKSSITSST